jgi:hypothetical protein
VGGIKDIFKALGDTFEGPWDTFEDTVKRSIKSFKVNSVSDALSVVKTIATGGAAPLADGGIAALNDFVFSKLAENARYIAEAFGGCIADKRATIGDTVERHLRDKHDWSAPMARLAREFVVANYDLITGYPECMCEQACIENVSKGLKDAGGIPGIIGIILWYIWPIMQGRPSKDIKLPPSAMAISPCLYWYGSGGQLLANAQLGESTTKAIAKGLKYINEDAGKKMEGGLPAAFNAYRPYLVDLVARGYEGPEAMGGTARRARFYFDHPDQAKIVIDASNILERQIAKVTEFTDKYLGWLDEAYAVGKVAYDLYQSQGDGSFDFDSIDAADLQRIAGHFLEKGRSLAESTADRYVRELRDKLELGEIADAYASARKAVRQAKKAKQDFKRITGKFKASSIPSSPSMKATQRATAAYASNVASNFLKSGNVAGLNMAGFGATMTKGQAFMAEWQPAQIGLEARQRWNNMIFAWANMTDAERAKWGNLDSGTNEELWATKGINYNGQKDPVCGKGRKSWFDLLTNDKRAQVAIYNLQLPSAYVTWLAASLELVKSLDSAKRAALRTGKVRVLGNPAGWKFVIPASLVPSFRDIGYPLGAKLPPGIPCTAEQYVLWFDDLQSIYDPRRLKATYETALYARTHGLPGVQEAWRNTTPSAVNPPVAWRAHTLDKLKTTSVVVKGVKVPLFTGKVTGGYLTLPQLWAFIFDMAKVPTLAEVNVNPAALAASTALAGQVAQTTIAAALEAAKPKIVEEAEAELSTGADSSSSSVWPWLLGAGALIAGVAIYRKTR